MVRIISLVSLLLGFSHLQAQLLDYSWFNLQGEVKSCNVICYDYIENNGSWEEGFPYSENISYQTDLNLVYLEFNTSGMVSKSKLYYPRSFYNPFETLYPIKDLEISDFISTGNYVTKLYSYSYTKNSDIDKLEVTDSRGRRINTSYINGRLVEDELYTYNEEEVSDKTVLSKRAKGSVYNYRRLETESVENKTIIKEFLNNRFLQSKSLQIDGVDYIDRLFVSKSRINASRESYNSDGLIVNRHTYYVNWRNVVKDWPDIDFDESLDYLSFISSLKRSGSESIEKYRYRDGKLVEKFVDDDVYSYIYNTDGLIETVYFNTLYKDYIYDEKGNWFIKIVGEIDAESKERIPKKKYLRTLMYY